MKNQNIIHFFNNLKNNCNGNNRMKQMSNIAGTKNGNLLQDVHIFSPKSVDYFEIACSSILVCGALPQ